MQWSGSGKLCSEGKNNPLLSPRRAAKALDKEADRALIGWKPINDIFYEQL